MYFIVLFSCHILQLESSVYNNVKWFEIELPFTMIVDVALLGL